MSDYKHGDRLGNGLVVVKAGSEEWKVACDRDLFNAAVPFWRKHSMGSLAHPSCFGCGQPNSMSTRHMELPDVFLCQKCVDSIKYADRIEQLESQLANARNEALEEAASVCSNLLKAYDGSSAPGLSIAKDQIRALKEKP